MSNVSGLTRTINAIVRALPIGTQWDVMLTHDTEVATVFNIWVKSKEERSLIHKVLVLKTPDWASETDEEFTFTRLLTIAIREC